jgi:hypothetical protein
MVKYSIIAILTIVLKPNPNIDPVKWSGHGSDGLTRVNLKKTYVYSSEKSVSVEKESLRFYNHVNTYTYSCKSIKQNWWALTEAEAEAEAEANEQGHQIQLKQNSNKNNSKLVSINRSRSKRIGTTKGRSNNN